MKRKISVALLLALVLSMLSAAALAETERIFDRAGLFDSAEISVLNEEIASFQADTGMDFVVLTSNEENDDGDQRDIADEFYDRGGFGLDAEKSGVLYFINMEDRYHYLSTAGAMIDYMTDKRIEEAIGDCNSDLAGGDSARAVVHMLSIVRGYIKDGIPEGQYRYDVLTGERLTSRHKALTSTEMLICAIAALVLGFVFTLIVQSRYKLKGSTYHYDFRSNSKVDITDHEDTYLRTTTVQTRKAEPPSGGGGGSSGGSGVHTSSGGGSHGGGGGHF